MRVSWRSPVVLAVGFTLLLQLWLCHFFAFGSQIPLSVDINPGNFRLWRCFIPPQPQFVLDSWLGGAQNAPAPGLTSLAAQLPVWIFFTTFYPVCAAIAVAGAYFLMRQIGLSRPAAAVGALAYGWQGWLLTNLLSGHFAPAEFIAVLPLAFGFAIRSVQRESWLDAALSGAFMGLAVGVGFDRGMLAGFLLGPVILFAIWHYLRHRPSAAALAVVRSGFLVAVAVAVAWQNMVPVLQSQTQNVVRGQGANPKEQYAWATQWSQTPEDFLTYFAPGLFGWRIGAVDDQGQPTGPYWGRIGRSEGWSPATPQGGMRNFYQECTGFGTAGAALALLGLIVVARSQRRNDPDPLLDTPDLRVWGAVFAVAAGLCCVMALGKFNPLYEFFYRLPMMNSWRNPHKFLYNANLCLAILAGIGLHFVLTSVLKSGAVGARTLALRCLWGVAIGCGVVLGWFIATGGNLRTALAAEGYAPVEIDSALGASQTGVVVAGLVAALLALAVKFVSQNPTHPEVKKLGGAPVLLSGIAGALVVLQMTWVFTHFLTGYNWEGFYLRNSKDMIDALAGGDQPTRVKVFHEQDPLLHNHLTYTLPYHGIQTIDVPAASRIPEDYQVFFGALMPTPNDNSGLWRMARLWQISGVSKIATPAALIQQLNTIPGLASNIAGVQWFLPQPASERDFSFFNMRTLPIADPRSLPPQAQQSLRAVLTLKDYLAKVTVVPAVELLPDSDAVVKRLGDPAWNPRLSSLAVETDAGPSVERAKVPPTAPTNAVPTVKLISYDRHAIEAEVTSSVPCVLRVNDKWDKDWVATVNNQPAPIFRSELVMRGVALPAGTSRVRMAYEPPTSGVWVSLIVWLAVGGWWAVTTLRSSPAPVPPAKKSGTPKAA